MAKEAVSEFVNSEKDAFVYVIEGKTGGPVKVGFTEHPRKRLNSLCIGSPEKLEIVHMVQVPWVVRKFVEKYAHALLRARHSHGEWFNVTSDQAHKAVTLALKGVLAGRLPPGPSCLQMKGEGYSPPRIGTPFGTNRMTPKRAVAAKRYADLIYDATHIWTRDEEVAIDARRKILKIHAAIREKMTGIGVTLLDLVIGAGQTPGSLPGSYAQHSLMRKFVFYGLDEVYRLTED